VRNPNQRSTWLSQEEPVGVKCIWKRGCLASQSLTVIVLWVERLSQTTCTATAAATILIPPRPSTFASAPSNNRQARSSRCGRVNDKRAATRSESTAGSVNHKCGHAKRKNPINHCASP